jgi:ATP-dependent Clp protease ATP-binding subunit ClpA
LNFLPQNDGYIAQDHLILALLDDTVIKQIFKEANVSDQAIRTAISAVRAGRKVDSKNAEEGMWTFFFLLPFAYINLIR